MNAKNTSKSESKKSSSKSAPKAAAADVLEETTTQESELQAAQEEIQKESSPKAVGPQKVPSAPAEQKQVGTPKAKYDITINGEQAIVNATKIDSAIVLVRHALANGMTVEEFNTGKFVSTFEMLRQFASEQNTQAIREELADRKARYATKEEKLILHDGNKYALCNQWYPRNITKLHEAMAARFEGVVITESSAS